jgi:hypothetical protein
MDVAGHGREVSLFVHKYAFVSTLIEMAGPSVPPVKITRVDNVEMAHKFGEIAQGSLGEQMKVVGHQNIAVKLDGVNMKRLGKNLQKALSVTIIFEDVFLFVSSAADMVNSPWILNP